MSAYHNVGDEMQDVNLWVRAVRCFLVVYIFGVPSVSFATNYETLKAGVVKITAEFENGKSKHGTGFVIRLGQDEAYVVTASHVVDDKDSPRPKIHVTFYPDKLRAMPAEINNIQSIDKNPRGVAALRVTGNLPSGIVALRWGTSDVLDGGESIDLIGFPRIAETPWAITSGRISGWKGEYLTLSGTIDEGNSGGPIFLNGEVVGVVMENQRSFSYAVPGARVGRLAKNWGILPRWPPAQKEDPHAVPVPSPPSGAASLVIHSTPSGAQVLLDDHLMGTTANGSLTLNNVDPGEYDIVVRKKGFAPWTESIEVYPGESRTLTATLHKGGGLNITGTWKDPENPTLSYVFVQSGSHVTMQEITANLFGASVTAQGEGQLEGNRVNVFYTTILGTNGRSQALVSEDGKSMVGSYQDLSTGLTQAISLLRASD